MIRRLMLTAVLVLVSALAGPTVSAGPHNVIFLTVDTLRADHLSAYGYKYKTSPNIDKLLKRGTMFENASSNVPLTNPSFTTMFTSRYPHETGAIRNGIPMVDGIPTLATLFKRRGYNTAAVISNWPLKRHLSKLDQGFDSYEDDFHEKRWLIFNDERDAGKVADLAIGWLDRAPKEPFFLWVHFSDPHSPYVKHDDFTFGGSNSDVDRYDSEIGYTDFHLGRVIQKLESMGLFERSLVVFVSDHGESLGEHGYTGHGRRVYQPGLHVPLMLAGPGIPAGRTEDALVQILDLAPTALSFAGVPVPASMRGLDLMPMIREGGGFPDREIHFETYAGSAPQIEGAEKILKKPIWVGLRKGGEKLLFSVRFQRWEKYDLAADPGELHDLANIRDPGFIKESDKLLGWYQEWEDKTVVGQVGAMTDEDREKFKALGYVDTP